MMLRTVASVSTSTIRPVLARSTAAAARNTNSRFISSQGTVAAEKFRSVMEEFRKENYTQETPARFKKDVIKAIDKNENGDIQVEGIEHLLSNIGAEGRLTRTEIESIFSQTGETRKQVLSLDSMMTLMKGGGEGEGGFRDFLPSFERGCDAYFLEEAKSEKRYGSRAHQKLQML
eukprot:CAMPEP_0197432532 /NCGR_PEP_ID=MMETSP1175-20131217/564_1 /TAXON_ID=1003142 /ORGANISM="Triceratium dubium, Strain CCMP147" /LENGTH=174 /DNA_ID=CAMNT_0042960615 /DNA_START=128 /DNA_END=653 /DNA_ORIENTATION=+